jgi:hypothetical protein
MPSVQTASSGQGSNTNNRNQSKKLTIQVKQGRINFTTLAVLPNGAPMMTGTFSIHLKPAILLFDSGASHSFISAKFGAKVGLDFCHTKRTYMIATPGEKVSHPVFKDKTECITICMLGSSSIHIVTSSVNNQQQYHEKRIKRLKIIRFIQLILETKNPNFRGNRPGVA